MQLIRRLKSHLSLQPQTFYTPDDTLSFKQTIAQGSPIEYVFDTDYELYDIKASVDVLDEIPAIDNFMFRDYIFQEGLPLTNTNKCSLSLSTDKPVDYIMGTDSMYLCMYKIICDGTT